MRPFLGIIGFPALPQDRSYHQFADQRTFGSGYYHSAPSNDTLVWDRLAFSLMLTSMFTIVVTEFVDRRVGRLMLAPLALLGLASILYWSYTEGQGHGDVRFYALVQFYPVLAMPVIFLLCRSRYTYAQLPAVMWMLYAIAKAAEVHDREIFDWAGSISGHTLKHFIAACASYVPLYALQRRTLRPGDLPAGTTTSAAILDVPAQQLHGANGRARPRARVAVTATAMGFAITLLSLSIGVASLAAVHGDEWPADLDQSLFSNLPVIWLGLWTLSGVMFFCYYRSSPTHRARSIAVAIVSRQSSETNL